MMKPLEVISMICCLMSCLSCSVKEDRATCPCRLILDFSGNDTVSVRSAQLLVNTSEGFCLTDTLICEDFKDEYVVSVPRGEVNVLAWYGGNACVSGNEGLKIPYGEDCPEVYMDFFKVEADGETAMCEVKLRKNHCRATIYVKTDETFPYRLLVKGEVDGYYADGLPSYGSFMYELQLSENMTGHVTLPRQRNESLCLEVYDGDSVLKVFTLGRYISATGYDWTAEHLDDLTLSLDYTHNIIGITIGAWDKEHHFDISI
ncbi:MAG: hypothetical protein IKV05_05460 [Bacteroidales bacterium]|nr:hypothetical protein [Bacteroidales bacterium]